MQIYHACDGPGLSILCFMRYDVMEYFSVYGTALSMWVTLIGESVELGPKGRCKRQVTTEQRLNSEMLLEVQNWSCRGEGGEKMKKVTQAAA